MSLAEHKIRNLDRRNMDHWPERVDMAAAGRSGRTNVRIIQGSFHRCELVAGHDAGCR